MKIRTFILSGTGAQVTPWHRVDSKNENFNIGVNVDLSQSSDASYGIDLGFTDTSRGEIVVSISRSGTTATINTVNAQLAAAKTGDSIVVQGAGDPFDGTFAVTNTAGVLTYTVANSGPTQSNLGTAVTATLIRVDPFNTTQTAGDSFSITIPCSYVRLNVATATTGQVAMTVVQGG